MASPLSTSEGVLDLPKKLKEGRTTSMVGDEVEWTRAQLDWTRSFDNVLEEWKENSNYRAMYECEIVVAHEAMKLCEKELEDSNLRWARWMTDIRECVNSSSRYYDRLQGEYQRFKDAVGGIDLSSEDDNKKALYVGKRTMNNLQAIEEQYGVEKRVQLKIGLAKTVRRNNGMFKPNLQSQAEDLLLESDTWMNYSDTVAEAVAENIGTCLSEASEKGWIHEREYRDKMSSIKKEEPDFYKCIAENFEEEPLSVV